MARWFGGKVTLKQQMIGLSRLQHIVPGRTVFDLGCAEGDIAARCLSWGALYVDGADNRPDAVAVAQAQGVGAVVADADTFAPVKPYDVVLLLGVLHKLRDPAGALRRMLQACDEQCIIRLPEGQWPILRDSRSGGEPINLGAVAERAGFTLAHETVGPFGQWVGWLQR